MASVMITGGAGFVGSHLTEALLDRGDRVLVLDNLSTGRLRDLDAIILSETIAEATIELAEPAIPRG